MTPVSRETSAVAAAVFGESLPLARRYAEVLATAGVERGLIGPREADRLWERHLLNCAVVADLFPAGASVCDVGSGAGLPGLVLALMRPDLDMHLVESLQRRADFLRETVSMLGLANVTVLRDRAENLAGTLRTDVATARAVAPLDRLAGWCLPLLRPGGTLLALKGAKAAEELAAAEPALRKLGASEWGVEQVGAEVLADPTTVVRVTASAEERPAAVADDSRSSPGRARDKSRTSAGRRPGKGQRG
jgi:16S rRNA (guanine527-N7)-methyltransferase